MPLFGRAKGENPGTLKWGHGGGRTPDSLERRGENRGNGGAGTTVSLEKGETGDRYVEKSPHEKPVLTEEREEPCNLIRTKGERPLQHIPVGTLLTVWGCNVLLF